MLGKTIAFWPMHCLSIIARDSNLGIYGMKLGNCALIPQGLKEVCIRRIPWVSKGLILVTIVSGEGYRPQHCQKKTSGTQCIQKITFIHNKLNN